MLKIAIGISVYNNATNVKNLINSILAQTKFPFEQYKIVVCDDGSNYKNVSQAVSKFCQNLNIPCIKNSENKGVPYSWNRLTEYYDCQYMVILNDDTRVIYDSWLNDILFFLDKNPKVGIVDWRENIVDSTGELIKSTTSYHGQLPKLKLKPSGPFFAFRKEIWSQIEQPDGSTGFWEDLLAYREELDFAAEFASRGFYTVQLPFYMEHFKSQTFNQNPDSRIRKEFSKFLSEREFLGKYYAYTQIGEGSQKSGISKGFQRFKQLPGWIFPKSSKPKPLQKIEYSRAMFAKKWEKRSLFESSGIDYLCNPYIAQKAFLESLSNLKFICIENSLEEAQL